MQKITTTIKRQWLSEIVARKKKTEYREIKPYWNKKLAQVKTPFLLRLISGRVKSAPEVTVKIDRVRKNTRARQYELHISRVMNVQNWNRRSGGPGR